MNRRIFKASSPEELFLMVEGISSKKAVPLPLPSFAEEGVYKGLVYRKWSLDGITKYDCCFELNVGDPFE